MNNYIKKIIIKKFGDKYDLQDKRINLLKLSTPNSGKGPYSKVIFLVFKNNENLPFLCVKTVRKNSDNNTINNGFDRLNLLYKLTKNSPFEKMFPRPLMILEDNNKIAFSIETACCGVKPKTKQLEKILTIYKKQQLFLFKKKSIYINNLDQYVKYIITELCLNKNDKLKLWKYYQTNVKINKNIKIPMIAQHGDLTLDNIFINDSGIYIFDCERFGIINIAGFDFFHLLSRIFKNDLNKLASNYLNNYFSELGSELKLDKQLVFTYWIHELLIKKKTLLDELNLFFIINGYLSLIK